MSRANVYNLTESIYFHFTIYDTDGETPLSGEEQIDCTYTLLRDTLPVAVPPVTIAECGTTGTYYALIIPVNIGTYQFRVIGNNDTNRTWHTFDFEIIDQYAGLGLVEQVLNNRLSISLSGSTYYQQLWDDTGTNVIRQWELFDKDGLDVVLTGRGPVSRGVPSGG